MKIEIDRQLCNGHAMCYRTSPDLFVLDGDGFGFVREGCEHVPAGLESLARDAVLNCPEGAVIVTEE